jgi:uncharacterized protein (DUF2336 family)
MLGSLPGLIPELASIVREGPTPRRVEAIRRLADLFAAGAAAFQAEHIGVFDDVFGGLIGDMDAAVRAELAARMAVIANAPPALVTKLATEDDIRIAAPLLRRSSRLDDTTLVEVARTKSQLHLFAISERAAISTEISDIVVRRGDRDVVRSIAGNHGAAFSTQGFSGLLKRAREDGMLATKIGVRPDLSPSHLKSLIEDAPEMVRRHIAAHAPPMRRSAIEHLSAALAGHIPPVQHRDFTAARQQILALHRMRRLDETALYTFARERKYEEAIAALAAMSGVPIELADRLIMDNERPDSVLLLGRAIGLEWDTVRALMLLRFGSNRVPSNTDIETARTNFDRIATATAQRVQRFWQRSTAQGPAEVVEL